MMDAGLSVVVLGAILIALAVDLAAPATLANARSRSQWANGRVFDNQKRTAARLSAAALSPLLGYHCLAIVKITTRGTGR